MNNLMKLRFDDAAISDIEDINPSFATGKLTVMYTGANPNGTYFSRGVVESALPTMKNIPIVAHYNKEENEIGSHDIELASDKDGNFRIRNLTEPCGVVPESAVVHFENKPDASGNVHEYLVVEPVILWKRQDVFNHITNDLNGKVDHSMEINVTAYHKEKGSKDLIVDSFEFQAYCLLESAAPCFSGSELELYAASEFKTKMAEMMAELKEVYSLNAVKFNLPSEDMNIKTDFETKGGDEKLEDKLALIAEYGLTVDDIDFALEDYSLEEIEAKLKEFDNSKTEEANAEETVEEFEKKDAEPSDTYDGDTPVADDDPAPAEEGSDDDEGGDAAPEAEEEDTDESIEGMPRRNANYELSSEMSHVLAQSLRNGGEVDFPWGKEARYCMVDFDANASMVYAMDLQDSNLYGFTYTMVGDNAVVNFESKKRMKTAFVEFKDGDEASGISDTFSHFENKYQEVVDELMEFKLDVENKANAAAREEVLAKFEDLSEFDAFNELKENAAQYSIEALEEKCYALRGKLGVTMKFSATEKSPKLKVVKNDLPGEPYGGLFVRYGIGKNN